MEIGKRTIRRVIIGVLICVAAYWLLHETDRVVAAYNFLEGIFSPFVIGAGIAFVLNVPMRAIENRLQKIKSFGLRRGLALVISIVLILLVLSGVLWLLVPQLVQTIQGIISQLPVFFNNTKDYVLGYMEKNPNVSNWINENIGKLDIEALTSKAIGVLESGLSVVIPSIFTLISNVYNGIFNGVIAFVFGIYCLVRKEILSAQARRILYSLVPEHISDEVVRIMRMTTATFSNFLSGQCLEALILGSLFAVAMAIFRMPYIPLVCVLIAVTALIPIVGAFVGCALGAFFILVNDPVQAMWFVVMFLLLQQFENNVIYPKVVGKSVGLPGMWVLLAVSVGGAIFGVAGMLLMIPVFSVLYTLMREFTEKRLAEKGIERSKLNAQPPELGAPLFGKKKKKPDEASVQPQEEEKKDNE